MSAIAGAATGGTWIARRRNERRIYREARLGLADDLQDANGDSALDFSQAQRNARTWWTHEQRLASGLGATPTGSYTVARAMADYLEDYRRRGGKASDSIGSVTRRNILPELGNVSVVKLTTGRLLDWHVAVSIKQRLLADPERNRAQLPVQPTLRSACRRGAPVST